MKKYITTTSIGIFFILIPWMILSLVFPEYNRYFSYAVIVLIIPFLIFKLVKQRKEDKANGTQDFKFSIYNILIAMVFMGILFYLIHSKYPWGS